MLAKALLSLAVGALLLGPSMAEAQVCLPLEGSSFELTLERLALPTAEARPPFRADAPLPRSADGVLWCQGADDPRCVPVTPVPEGFRSVSSGPSACLPGEHAALGPARELSPISESTECAAALPGCRFRVDRPPRA